MNDFKPYTDFELDHSKEHIHAYLTRLKEQCRRANRLAEAFKQWQEGDDKDDPDGGSDLFDACEALQSYFGTARMLIAGFTGTRYGMTSDQRDAVLIMLVHSDVLKHGDCKGSDEQAHSLFMAMGRLIGPKFIEIHPPIKDEWRANCQGANQVFAPKPYLQRNQDIVNGSRVLIAVPSSFEEQSRGGTWSTIRYAVRCGKPVRIIYPDGKIEKR